MYKKIKCEIFIFIFIINYYYIQCLNESSFIKKGKIKNNIKLNLRQLQKSKKFLHNDILDAENNKLINNYLSTKYLYWNKGFNGQKIKIGILDSGINNNISKCKNIIKIKNFSEEEEINDTEGHGSYLSSIICGEKYGLSKESNIYIYKIFTGNGTTKKSWLIKALSEAIFIDKCKIINLSFGGINYNDNKIIELINIASNNNILIISSSGNEGPSYGTISFPGVLPNVLTIGSLSKEIFSVYKYSSRGPAMIDKETLIAKPNVYAPGEEIIGLSFDNKIKSKKNLSPIKIFKNGSSIATAIVTGFIGLALSIKDDENYLNKWNIAYLMNVIKKTNIFLPELNNEYERFSGLFNPQGLLGYLLNEKETNRALVYFYNYDYSFNQNKNIKKNKNLKNLKNPKLNYPEEVLYSTKQEKEISLLLLNELDSEKYDDIVFPFYIKEIQILYSENKEDINKDYIKKSFLNDNCVKFELISPNKTHNITRVMPLKLKISPENENKCNFYKGDIELRFIIVDQSQKQILNFFYSYHFIPKPLKLNRILFDRGHNLIYPYDKNIMKDSLLSESFDYDWTYESIYTNFKGLNDYLLKNLNSLSGLDDDYYIEETTKNLNSINLNLYSVLIIIDAEKKFTDEEIKAMQNALENNDLGILIISEWNNELIKNKINNINLKKNNEKMEYLNESNITNYSSGKVFFDGSNVSNLNKFLLKYNIALSQNTISGNVYLMNKLIEINSGTSISLFPKGGLIFGSYFDNDESFLLDPEGISMTQNKNNSNNEKNAKNVKTKDKLYRAILGVLDNSFTEKENFGRLAIFTDSYCLDDYQYKRNIKSKNCFWLIKNLIQFLIHGTYIINDLNLQSKNRLKKNYYNNEPIYFEGKNKTNDSIKLFYINNENKEFTDEIPNLFEVELGKQIKFPSNKDMLGVIKGILIVFGSIFFVLLIMLYIINIKEEKNRQMRYNAIKTLEEIVPLSMRINDKKYNIKFANFISSDEYFYFYDSQQ